MLTDRQMMILRMIVDNYVLSAEPVGSRTISKQTDLGLSAATIRNEMADLEELGYLEQPHASAGRIPSQMGYRFYVDHLLLGDTRLSRQEIVRIKSLFTERIGEMERVAQQTALFLSNLTQYTAVVLGPQVFDTTLKNLQLVALNDHAAVLLMVASSGQVYNRTVNMPEGVSLREMENLVRVLNEKLSGTPMYRIRSRALEEITHEVARHMRDYEEAVHLLDQVVSWLESDKEGKVYLGGATNMLLQPEFRDVHKAQPVLTWLERHHDVMEALRSDESTLQLQVRIGGENDVQSLHDCSLITATYSIGGLPMGVIGLIGPTRMDYARAIPLLGHLSKGLGDLFTKFYVS